MVCVYSYTNLRKRDDGSDSGSLNSKLPHNKLFLLEDAQRFFGAPLKLPEMFKLASDRVAEIIPFDASVLFLPDDDRAELRAVFAEGENADPLREAVREDIALAEMAFHSGEVELGEGFEIASASIEIQALNEFSSAAAIPLSNEGRVFAVFQIYSRSRISNDDHALELLRAVGEKLAPLLIGSITFEPLSISNALTDHLTGLPNERAFYMIIESQLAECQRSRDERPLTVLSIDIREFASVNAEYGHATGDRVLSFAADSIKAHLRKMDFLARRHRRRVSYCTSDSHGKDRDGSPGTDHLRVRREADLCFQVTKTAEFSSMRAGHPFGKTVKLHNSFYGPPKRESRTPNAKRR